jgi:hypothetical protein
VCTLLYGFVCSRFKIIRLPLATGFVIWTGGLIGLSCIQPNDGSAVLGVVALVGIGIAGPLSLILAGIQLSIPHSLMATGTAVAVSSRALGAAVSTAIYGAIVGNRLGTRLPAYISQAVLDAGLPPSSVSAFIRAVSAQDDAALVKLPGVTPSIIAAGVAALRQAFVDSIRVVWIIGACLGVPALVCCYFLGSFRDLMTYKVEAPIEGLQPRKQHNAADL